MSSRNHCYRDVVPIGLTLVHPSRSFATGLAASFDPDRFSVVRVDQLDPEPTGVILFAVFDDADWERLDYLTRLASVTVVALIPDLDVATYARALSFGASGVAHVDTDPETIRIVTEAALSHEVVVPAQAAHAMARQMVGRQQVNAQLDESEVALLQRLSEGATVVQLAEATFVAERTIRRKLQGVYLKLSVGGRAEALKRAAQLGLVS